MVAVDPFGGTETAEPGEGRGDRTEAQNSDSKVGGTIALTGAAAEPTFHKVG